MHNADLLFPKGYVTDANVDYVGLLGISFDFDEFICYMYNQCNRIQPTIVQQLKTNGYIQRNAFSLWLNDATADSGSILFGAIDTTKYSGDLISLPMQSSQYNGNVSDLTVTLSSVSITTGSGTTLLSSSDLAVPALLDSGTPNTELPAYIADAIIAGLGGVETELGTTVPCRMINADANLTYGFGGEGGPKITLPLSQLMIDAGFQFEDGSEACTLGIDAVETAEGGDILLGDTFLRSAYVVYDLENLQIAMAQAKYGSASTSSLVLIPSGTGLPGVSSTATLAVSSSTAVATATGEPGGQAVASYAGVSGIATGTPTFSGLGTAITSGASYTNVAGAAAAAAAEKSGTASGSTASPTSGASSGVKYIDLSLSAFVMSAVLLVAPAIGMFLL